MGEVDFGASDGAKWDAMQDAGMQRQTLIAAQRNFRQQEIDQISKARGHCASMAGPELLRETLRKFSRTGKIRSLPGQRARILRLDNI